MVNPLPIRQLHLQGLPSNISKSKRHFFIIHILTPLYIFCVAKKEYPEFSGLKARKYPGQENPRRQVLIPRRQKFLEKQKCTEIVLKTTVKKPKILFANTMPKVGRRNSILTTVDIN